VRSEFSLSFKVATSHPLPEEVLETHHSSLRLWQLLLG